MVLNPMRDTTRICSRLDRPSACAGRGDSSRVLDKPETMSQDHLQANNSVASVCECWATHAVGVRSGRRWIGRSRGEPRPDQDDLALRIAGLRPGEMPFLQPLGTDPESAAIPDKDLQPIALGIAEHCVFLVPLPAELPSPIKAADEPQCAVGLEAAHAFVRPRHRGLALVKRVE
jgi:hypothetical protein